MKMTVEEIIKKSSVENMAKIIGSVIAMHIDGISAEEATKIEYKETLKVLQSEMEVDYQPTNADRIRSMSYEELTEIIMCPYDTSDKPVEIMPCVKYGNIQELVPPEDCKKCMMKWLQSEVEEKNREINKKRPLWTSDEELESHDEKHILESCISLMQGMVNEFAEWYRWKHGEDAIDELDEEERFCIRKTYFRIVQELFLIGTNHSGGTSTRAKCNQLNVDWGEEIEFYWSDEE